jgi:hypothetical protein
VSLEVSELQFAAQLRDGGALVTPSQSFYVERTAGAPSCFGAVDVPWLALAPATFVAPARLVASLKSAVVSALNVGRFEGHIVVSCSTTPSMSLTVRVTLTTSPEHLQTPIGSWDTPGNALVMLGSQPVTLSGWALDEIGIDDVFLCIDRRPNQRRCTDEPTPAIHTTLGYGIMPRITSEFSAFPLSRRAGWWYSLGHEDLKGFAGTIRLSAVAHNLAGRNTIVGTRLVTIAPPAPKRFTRAEVRRFAPFELAALGFLLCQFVVWRALRRPTSTAAAEPVVPWAIWDGVAVTAAAAVFVYLNIGRMLRGFSYDELYTASQAVIGVSLWNTATTVVVFNNHIAYSLAAGITTQLFGPAEWAVRLPAFVAGIAMLFAVAWLGRLLGGRSTGLLSAALLALSPTFGEWSTSARGYSMLAMATVVSTACLFQLLRRSSRRALVGHAAFSVLAIYVHLYGIWAFLFQYIAFTAAMLSGRFRDPHGMRQLWWSFNIAAAITTLLYLPIASDLLTVYQLRGHTDAQEGLPYAVYQMFTATQSMPLMVVLSVLAGAGLLRRFGLLAIYSVIVGVIPLFAMWLIVRPSDLYPRFFVYGIPLFVVFVAAGLVAIAGRLSGIGSFPRRLVSAVRVAVAVLLMTWIGTDWLRQDRLPPGTGYGELLHDFGPDGWPTFAVGGNAEMFDYYLGKPLNVMRGIGDLDTALHQFPRIKVLYHDMPWNSSDDRAMQATLARRCRGNRRSAVELYRCGE